MFKDNENRDPRPLRIDGVGEAPMTLEPDDAELAAQALLETMAGGGEDKKDTEVKQEQPASGTPDYYRRVAEKVRQARYDSLLRAVRFLAFCEQELENPSLPATGPGSLALLEAELYKRIDTVDREGGDLKRRWQHCLARVTVRLMEKAEKEDTEETGKR